MDTKWIPAALTPDWKSWSNRVRELSGFKGWLKKFASWLCLVHDRCSRAQGSFRGVIPCGNCESRLSHSKLSIVSFRHLRVDNVVKAQMPFMVSKRQIVLSLWECWERKQTRSPSISWNLFEIHGQKGRQTSVPWCQARMLEALWKHKER